MFKIYADVHFLPVLLGLLIYSLFPLFGEFGEDTIWLYNIKAKISPWLSHVTYFFDLN